MKNLPIALLISASISCKLSKPTNEIWNELSENTYIGDAQLPSDYLLYQLNIEQLQERLSLINNDNAQVELTFPDPQGRMVEYVVTRSGTVSESLLKKYPSLTAYKGVAVSDKKSKIRFEIPGEGLQLMGTTVDGVWYVSPFSSKSNHYIFYYKDALQRKNTFWEGSIN